MTNSDAKPRNHLTEWWASLTPAQRTAHGRKARAAQGFKATAGSFKPGDPRAAEAGRKGGKASGDSKRRDMKGKKRVKPVELKISNQSLRGMDA